MAMREITFSKDMRKLIDKVYKEERQKVEKSIRNFANNILISLRENSPKRTGKYAKSWKITEKHGSKIIHNSRYRLTHLLEDGFINVAGRYTKAQPHILKAFEDNLPKFLEELKK